MATKIEKSRSSNIRIHRNTHTHININPLDFLLCVYIKILKCASTSIVLKFLSIDLGTTETP